MAWIRTISTADATGRLRRLYEQAIDRAGKVFHVIQIQGLRPNTLAASTRLYSEVMHSPDSPLSRAQREMIATAVSRANECHYWTRAHGDDLRDEVEKTESQERADELRSAIMEDYRTAELSDGDRAMLDFCIELTLRPGRMERRHVEELREHGFSDTAIHDIVQVAALFNYYNRIADGLGIDDEPDW